SLQLSVTRSTANTYRYRLMQKLQFTSTAQLVQYALTNKLFDE
ncbi:MAG: response regulator transcription factor, partial [Deltaproteobacteria bacterium]|nr:response regulator transcription factor [Deltaproteobacteria bacterium]